MKWYLPVLVTIAAIVVVSLSAASAEAEYDYFDEGDFSYEIVDGEAYVVGLASGAQGDIVIPATVTHNDVVYNVTAITGYLYSHEVTSLTLGKNIEEIPIGGFQMDGLEAINVPVENDYFASLDGVLFTKNMRTLIKYPDSKADTSYTVPGSVSSLESYSFEYTSVESITLNDGLVRVGVMAFYGNDNLTHINSDTQPDAFPKSVAIIGDFAFNGCVSLTTFELYEGMEFIGTYAFSETAITTMDIPGSITTIGEGAFSYCTNLTKFISGLTYNDHYDVIDDVLYDFDHSTLISFPCAKTCDEGKFVFPETVRKISAGAFSGTVSLKEVVLNKGLTTIDYAAFMRSSIETINLDHITYIDSYAFNGCKNLKNVQFSSRLYYIGGSAFGSSGLESIELTEGLVDIEPAVFSGCNNMKTATFNKACSVEVPYHTFWNCLSLKAIYIEGYDVTFDIDSLNIGLSEETHATVDVYTKNGYSLPSNVADENTTVIVHEEGKGPYPYENLIGVAFCVILIIAILAFVREV